MRDDTARDRGGATIESAHPERTGDLVPSPTAARVRTRFSVGSTPGAHRRTGGPRSRASRHMLTLTYLSLTFFTELVCEGVDPAWLVAVTVQV